MFTDKVGYRVTSDGQQFLMLQTVIDESGRCCAPAQCSNCRSRARFLSKIGLRSFVGANDGSRYFRWNKSDLKDGRRDGESNKAFPLTPPSPPGRGRTCERFVKVRRIRLRSTHRSSAPRQSDHHLHDRTPWRTRPFQMSRVVLPLPWGEAGVRGKGLACRLRLSFQPPVSISPKIARNPNCYCSKGLE